MGLEKVYESNSELTDSCTSLVNEGIRIRHGTLLVDKLSLDEIIVDFVYDFETRHQVLLCKGGKINVIKNNPARRRHLLSSREPKFLIEEHHTLPSVKSILYVARYGFYAGNTDTHLHVRCIDLLCIAGWRVIFTFTAAS